MEFGDSLSRVSIPEDMAQERKLESISWEFAINSNWSLVKLTLENAGMTNCNGELAAGSRNRDLEQSRYS
jgi:hypothetical protein